MQDPTLLWLLYKTLLRTQVSSRDADKRTKEFKKINKLLNELRSEAESLRKAGHPISSQKLTASLSAGQLAVFLDGSPSLGDLVRRLTFPHTFGLSLNPVLELWKRVP